MSDYDLSNVRVSTADSVRAAARKALAVLREAEWHPSDHTKFAPCPLCMGWREMGHEKDCALAEAIASLEGVL